MVTIFDGDQSPVDEETVGGTVRWNMDRSDMDEVALREAGLCRIDMQETGFGDVRGDIGGDHGDEIEGWVSEVLMSLAVGNVRACSVWLVVTSGMAELDTEERHLWPWGHGVNDPAWAKLIVMGTVL